MSRSNSTLWFACFLASASLTWAQKIEFVSVVSQADFANGGSSGRDPPLSECSFTRGCRDMWSGLRWIAGLT